MNAIKNFNKKQWNKKEIKLEERMAENMPDLLKDRNP